MLSCPRATSSLRTNTCPHASLGPGLHGLVWAKIFGRTGFRGPLRAVGQCRGLGRGALISAASRLRIHPSKHNNTWCSSSSASPARDRAWPNKSTRTFTWFATCALCSSHLLSISVASFLLYKQTGLQVLAFTHIAHAEHRQNRGLIRMHAVAPTQKHVRTRQSTLRAWPQLHPCARRRAPKRSAVAAAAAGAPESCARVFSLPAVFSPGSLAAPTAPLPLAPEPVRSGPTRPRAPVRRCLCACTGRHVHVSSGGRGVGQNGRRGNCALAIDHAIERRGTYVVLGILGHLLQGTCGCSPTQ